MSKIKEIKTPKLGTLSYSFDFFYESWYKAGKPQKHKVLCYFGSIDPRAQAKLEEYGFAVKIVETSAKGTVYTMELLQETQED